MLDVNNQKKRKIISVMRMNTIKKENEKEIKLKTW